MRVLHVITGLAAGGAERQLLLLAPRLSADCEVVALTNPGAVADGLRAAGVPVHHLGMRGNRDLAALPRLVRLIRDGRYDIVHTHLYRAGLYGRLAARLAGVRHIVATEHSIGETVIEGRPMTPAVRTLYRGAERLGVVTIAVSAAVAGRLARWGVPASRVTVIPNGIDAGAFAFDRAVRDRVRAELGVPAGRLLIGGVGRLEPGKRFDVLIDALAGLPDAVLLLAGAGSAEPRLREQARRRGVADRVIWTGETTGVPGLLSAMDVLAAPSPQETFGLAVLEALAAGLPVRYTACPALDDLPGMRTERARRIPADAGAYRAALAELAAPAEPAAPMPEPAAARVVPQVVHHYDIDRAAAQVDRLYELLLADDPRAARPRTPSRTHRSTGGDR